MTVFVFRDADWARAVSSMVEGPKTFGFSLRDGLALVTEHQPALVFLGDRIGGVEAIELLRERHLNLRVAWVARSIRDWEHDAVVDAGGYAVVDTNSPDWPTKVRRITSCVAALLSPSVPLRVERPLRLVP